MDSTPLVIDEVDSDKNGQKKGLGVVLAAIFLAGEMAGSGVLALPEAIVGTGWSGLILIFLFSVNASYIGSRFGIIWPLLAEKFDEFKDGDNGQEGDHHIRDPYPLMAEKVGLIYGAKVSTALRLITTGCILLTLYGAGCVFLILCASFASSLFGHFSLCLWLVVVTACLTPFTWMGTPKDFWPMAILALSTTSLACVLAVVQIRLDVTEGRVQCTTGQVDNTTGQYVPEFPGPTPMAYFTGFGSMMFAFGGASIFPTIQADMANKGNFKWAAIVAMSVLFILYTPVASVGYFSLGSCVKSNILDNLSKGPVRSVAEAVLFVHLMSAVPIVANTPSQYFEHLMGIPKSFNWKRCLFRTFSMAGLLFISETLPSFGNILNLIGGSTVTLLTFVFPPLFYILACDTVGKSRYDLPLYERCYCWLLIAIGLLGGFSATYAAIVNIFGSSAAIASPCYL